MDDAASESIRTGRVGAENEEGIVCRRRYPLVVDEFVGDLYGVFSRLVWLVLNFGAFCNWQLQEARFASRKIRFALFAYL